MSNRLQVLVALSGFGLGLITIYGPTWLFLRDYPGLRREAFLDTYPQKRLQIVCYEVVSFLGFLMAPLLVMFFMNDTSQFMRPALYFCFFANSIGFVNGVFEVLTAICPRHGISYRHAHNQVYTLHPRVRKIGVLRIGLSILFVGTSLVVYRGG